VPRELEAGKRRVRRSGKQQRHVLQGTGGLGATVGIRDDGLAECHTKHFAVYINGIYRFVERPEPKTETVHAAAHSRRTRTQHRPNHMRVLFLRTPHGSGGTRGIDPVVCYGKYSTSVSRSVRLRRRH